MSIWFLILATLTVGVVIGGAAILYYFGKGFERF